MLNGESEKSKCEFPDGSAETSRKPKKCGISAGNYDILIGGVASLIPISRNMHESIAPIRDLRPFLVFLTGDLIAVPIPLERDEVVMGRALETGLRINDTKVSRMHAAIRKVDDEHSSKVEYMLVDLESRNGTFLNGQRITRERLQNGDKIMIGEHILRFDLLDQIDQEYQQQIHRLISHDDLTGLLSSRSFFSELRREAARSKAEDRGFCVLMMDIDHFKSVNDSYGHLTGSKTLEEIGSCIVKSLRSGDAAARFGGEEFAAFLLDAELAQAQIAAERIRSSIEEQAFSVMKRGQRSASHHVTISIGISSFPEDSSDPIELVEMADSALYRAKREGRNRVCTYSEAPLVDPQQPLPSRSA